MLTFLSSGLSLVYPNETSDNWSRGGEILSASMNLNVTTSSSSGGSSSGSFSKILILDCACAARLALSAISQWSALCPDSEKEVETYNATCR